MGGGNVAEMEPSRTLRRLGVKRSNNFLLGIAHNLDLTVIERAGDRIWLAGEATDAHVLAEPGKLRGQPSPHTPLPRLPPKRRMSRAF